jgi:hypothetical protein
MKFVFTHCHEGFAANNIVTSTCQSFDVAKVKKGESGMLFHTTFADDPDYIVDELASWLSAGW